MLREDVEYVIIGYKDKDGLLDEIEYREFTVHEHVTHAILEDSKGKVIGSEEQRWMNVVVHLAKGLEGGIQ